MKRVMIVGALASMGCDVLGADAPAQPAPECPPVAEASNAKAEADPADDAAAPDPKPPVIAPLVAGVTAPPKSAPQPTLPMTLADLRVSFEEEDDEPTEMALTVDATANREIWEGTDLWIKARCETDGKVFSQAIESDAATSAELSSVAKGDSIVMQASFDALRVDAEASRCDLSFVLAGSYGGGPQIELGRGCWEEGAARLGACSTAVGHAPASGFAERLNVLSLALDQGPSYGGGLSLHYAVHINESLAGDESLVIKSACEVGDKILVDDTRESWSWGPFAAEPGEAVAGEVNLLWGVDGVDSRPENCDLTVFLGKGTIFASGASKQLYEACLAGETITPGPCDVGRAPDPAAKPVSATSLELSNLTPKTETHYSHSSKFTFELQLDATVREPIKAGSDVSLFAECRVGRTVYRDSSSVQIPAVTRVGESVRVGSRFFYGDPLAAKPSKCDVELRDGGGTALASFCSKGGKVVEGGC